ncbi:kin of IRRE-like protein 3 [Ptychodera flava]|uniref:kin of IRRE-like protein 3 n=1 Tax=Ptychodera flava TaxID=63121 RepID=UPI00396A50F5
MFLYGVSAVHSFAIQPDNAFVMEGTSVQLRCQVNVTLDGGQNYKIQWQFNSTQSAYEVEEDFDRRNGSFTSILTITSVSRQDEGFYHCVLSGKSGITPTSSDSAQITILSTPRFLQEPKNVSAIEGFITVLRCKIDAVDSNATFVKWTKDNVTVAISDDTRTEENAHDIRYSIIGDNDKAYHLQIRKANQSDAGIFYCSVHLKYSGQLILKSHGATLDVLFPPDDSYPSCITVESKYYSAGDTLTTECISRGGNGPLRLSWLRNGEEINGTRVDDNNYNIRDTWTLTPTDNGANITCVMKGKAVLNRRQCEIGPLDVYVKPTVSIKPETNQVTVGQSVTSKESTVPTITTVSHVMQTGLSSAVISLVVMISLFFFAVIILASLIIRYHKTKTRKKVWPVPIP